MNKRSMSLLASLVVVAALAVLAMKFNPVARNRQGTDLAGAGESASNAGGNASRGPASKVEERPLPSVDMPLGAVIDDLKRRADRGEANAACRLAAEWTYCQGLQRQLQGNEAMLRDQERMAVRVSSAENMKRAGMSAEALERGINYAQDQVDRSRSQLAHCDGVPAPRPDEITRYWRRAALAGHLPSKRNYAVGNAFRRDEVLDNLPALAVYRQEAVRIAREAVAQGDLRAAIALAGAYSPQNARSRTYLSQLVEPDAGEALGLLYRINDVIGRSGRYPVHANVRSELAGMIEDLEATMSPQDVQAAGNRAGNSPPLVAGFRDLQGLSMVAGGFVADVPREECDLAAWGKDPYP